MFSQHVSRALVVRSFLRNNAFQGFGPRNLQLPSTPLSGVQRLDGVRPFSDGIFGRIKGSLEDREKKKQAEKYAEQMEKMANSELWTLKNFMAEIEESIPTGWRSKLPGVGNTQQAKAVEGTKKAIQAMLDEVGGDATVQDLEELGRKEKLKISLKTNVSVEEINVLIKQFKGTEIMHKVLRTQKVKGKPIPADEKGMKALFQSEAANVLSKAQKRSIQESRTKSGARGALRKN